MISPIDICNQALAHLGDRRIHRIDEDAQETDAIVRYCAEYYEQTKQEVLAAHRWTFAKKAVALTRSVGDAIFKYKYSHVLPTDMMRFLEILEAEVVGYEQVATGGFIFEPNGANLTYALDGELSGKPQYITSSGIRAEWTVFPLLRWTIFTEATNTYSLAWNSDENVPTPLDVVGSWTSPSGTMPLDLVAEYVDGDPIYAYNRKVDKFKIVGNKVWSNVEELGLFYIQNLDDPDQWTPHFRACVARKLASYLAGPVADNPGEAQRLLDVYERVDLPNAQFYDAVQDASGENSDMETRVAESPLLRSRYREGYTLGNSSDEPITYP